MYTPNGQFDPNAQAWQQQQQQSIDPSNAAMGNVGVEDQEDTDTSHRPPNAFILFSQAMRSDARQKNPTLSNTEVSKILGKMWKETPNEIKIQYKQKAAQLQDEFKKQHPDYTYRKARRKRALNELLTKSAQGFPAMAGGFPPADMSMYQMMPNGAANMYPPMMTGQVSYPGYAAMPPQQAPQMAPQQGMPGIPTMPGMAPMDPSQQQMYGGMQYNQPQQ